VSRKRKWEAGAILALLATLMAVGFAWLRYWKLNEDLVQAVYYSRHAEVRGLLRQGANPNYRDKYQQPLLTYAARGSGATLKALLQGGADPNVKTKEGEVPLVYAAGCGYLDVVQILLRSGVDVNAAEPDGKTALMAAVRSGETPVIVRELLRAGARTDLKNGEGSTAMQFARLRLLEAGQNVSDRYRREVALRQRKRRLEMIRMLQAAGAKH
jgi:ankyrin repeat protein